MAGRRIAEIRDARDTGKLPACFTRGDLRKACPNWPEGTYRAFLSKHAEGYAAQRGYTMLFVKCGDGRLYADGRGA